MVNSVRKETSGKKLVILSLYSCEIKKYFTLLKKIKNHLFPDIRIKIKIVAIKVLVTSEFLKVTKLRMNIKTFHIHVSI